MRKPFSVLPVLRLYARQHQGMTAQVVQGHLHTGMVMAAQELSHYLLDHLPHQFRIRLKHIG